MKNREVKMVIKAIERDASCCQVTGTRRYEDGSYAIDVTDTITGVSFAINSMVEWNDRMDQLVYSAD